MKYRVKLRGFDFTTIEHILRYSNERYFDDSTNRFVAIGSHKKHIVMIPYEKDNHFLKPITIHITTRQQINFRIKNGRFKYE